MTPIFTIPQEMFIVTLCFIFLAALVGDLGHSKFFRDYKHTPSPWNNLSKDLKALMLALIGFFTWAQNKDSLQIIDDNGLTDAMEEVISDRDPFGLQVEDLILELYGDELMQGGYVLPLDTGIPWAVQTGNPPFTSNAVLLVSQFQSGFACVAVTNIQPSALAMPPDAIIFTNWPYAVARQSVLLPQNCLPEGFTFGGYPVTNLYMAASGLLSFDAPKSSPLPATNGIPDNTAYNYIAVFQTPSDIVPTNGLFWYLPGTNSSLFTWKDVYLGQDTNCLATVQAELYRDGDFTCRYYFPSPTNSYAQLTNAFLIGAQNLSGGETVLYTNAISAIHSSYLPAFELRWKSLTGINPEDLDQDDDGIPTADELFIYRTNPDRLDSDGDGISDILEVGNMSDPLNPDENNDGVPDGDTPEDWHENPLWPHEGAPAKIRLKLLDPLPTNTFAVIRIGTLSIPLVKTNQWDLTLEDGERYDFELITSAYSGYNSPIIRLSINDPNEGVGSKGFFIFDPSKVFDGNGVRTGIGWMAFPSIDLASYSVCIHWLEKAVFPINYQPWGFNAWKTNAIFQSDGGTVTVGDNNIVQLTLAPLSSIASFSISFSSPLLRWGEVSTTAEAHRCESIPGPFCSVCGQRHEGGCTFSPLFVRVNTDDDDLDDMMDRDQSVFAIGEDDTYSFDAFIRGPQPCCCVNETNTHLKIISIASGLRLWKGNSHLEIGDETEIGFHVEALQPSQTLQGHPIIYEVHDDKNGASNIFSVCFQAANVLLQTDYNGDKAITAEDVALKQWLASQGVERWVIARRTEPYCLRIRNDCPTDAILSFSLTGETNRPAIKITTNGVIVATPLTGNVIIPPLSEKNTDKTVWLDASDTNSTTVLTFCISTTNDYILVTATQTVQIIDTRLTERWVRYAENEISRYDFSESTDNVIWTVYALPGLAYVSDGYGGIYDTPIGLPLGDYLVCAYFTDIMDDGAYSEGVLHIVDTVIEHDAYLLPCGSTNRTQISLCLTNATPPANWIIEPEVLNGARLFTSETGGSASVSITNCTTLWLSPGSIPANYSLTAVHPNTSNSWDKATVDIIKVSFSDSPTHDWDDVEEDVEPQPVIAAYPEHADEFYFRTVATPNINENAKLKYIKKGGQLTEISWNGNEPTITFCNGELNYQIMVLEGAESTPYAEVTNGNLIKVRHLNDGDQLVVALDSYPFVNGSTRVVKNFSWLDNQALGQNGIFFGTEFSSAPENIKSNIQNTVLFALSQSSNSAQAIYREAMETQMATIYTNPPPLLTQLNIPSARGIGMFPSDLYHLHITYSNEVPAVVQQAVDSYSQSINSQMSTLNINGETSYLTKTDRDKYWQLYLNTSSALNSFLGVVTNGSSIFIYHSYEFVGQDYTDPEGLTWMRRGDPIRNLRTDLANNNPFLIYPGDPNDASAVYQYQNTPQAIQLSFLIQKNGHILLFKSDTIMAQALQLRQAFDE